MWIVIVALAVLIIFSLLIVASRKRSGSREAEAIEPRPCPEGCRPCPACGAPVRRKATKCLYCGATLKPDLSQDFGNIALAPEAFEAVTNLVNNLNDDDARNYLKKNYGLNAAEATSAIDLYKQEHADLLKRPNWLPWIVVLAIILIIVFLAV